MAKNGPMIIILLIVLITVSCLFIINDAIVNSTLVRNISPDYSWLVHGFINILGYATVLLPGYLIFRYIRKINYFNKINSGPLTSLIHTCFGEDELITTNPSVATQQQQPQHKYQRTAWQEAFLLLFYFFGLQISYLSWGVLQEKVMTQEYRNNNGEFGHFKDSQFLVFINRILAVCMSGAVLFIRRQPRHKCPLYKYVYCSFSNIMSSWCQYEALKYVSFPHQVLAKAAKTIPVMIMGKIVSRTKYEYYEYVTAVILSIGMLIFMLDTGNDRATSTATTFSGAILLISYVTFDSFTSNWQGALFKNYHMKPVQMMCFVNMFSCLFTFVSLLQQGSFHVSLEFMLKYPNFIIDCILLSICSASGQLFIFSTLSDFGPLVFAIITTIRQGFSVLLSCIIYHHQVNPIGIIGVILVFISVLLRIYCGHRLRTIRKNQSIIINSKPPNI